MLSKDFIFNESRVAYEHIVLIKNPQKKIIDLFFVSKK